MVHDDRTYLDDEGLEYASKERRDEESESPGVVRIGAGGFLWGADEAYGGYDAE
ncbi:hypothetical protein [Melittangium boletus]|uniref:Uncharacterized protein n=1 Tax=Melittangium boletus DSM 14713 TaxID=1294270 RepID=A0A250IDY9_9BACT|nr:hypothetical protein [Melittangium boletus]ATB29453.1 hypothetical protein MEBOL_002902 [Melittangium boletus DSM 14713]